MKILKESKEALPIEFITTFVSEGWERVGILKSQMEAVSKTFSGAKQTVEIMQNLVDAYLICLGQMEHQLSDKDYLEMPEDAQLTESIAPAVDVPNDINKAKSIIADQLRGEWEASQNYNKAADDLSQIKSIDTTSAQKVCLDIDREEHTHVGELEHEYAKLDKNFKADIKDGYEENKSQSNADGDEFQYFVDFDEPDNTVERITDADLYGQDD